MCFLKMNFRSKTQFQFAGYIPEFYFDIFVSFNKSKYVKPIQLLNNTELLTQVIWGNVHFRLKNKTLYLKNCLSSKILFVGDLINENGNFLSETDLLQKLENKSNWISEYSILKKVFGRILNNFNTTVCRYINFTKVLRNKSFLARNELIEICKCSSKLFYNLLLEKKFEKPYTEKMWMRKLNINIDSNFWSDIYLANSKSVQYSKFAEFKYKILMNILTCGKVVSKWDKNVSNECSFCGDTETAIHMLFECKRIKDMWLTVGRAIQTDIQLKHIVIGLRPGNILNEVKNLLIVIVSYSIYSAWNKCISESLNFSNFDLMFHIKGYLIYYCKVYTFVFENKLKLTILHQLKDKILSHF